MQNTGCRFSGLLEPLVYCIFMRMCFKKKSQNKKKNQTTFSVHIKYLQNIIRRNLHGGCVPCDVCKCGFTFPKVIKTVEHTSNSRMNNANCVTG